MNLPPLQLMHVAYDWPCANCSRPWMEHTAHEKCPFSSTHYGVVVARLPAHVAPAKALEDLRDHYPLGDD